MAALAHAAQFVGEALRNRNALALASLARRANVIVETLSGATASAALDLVAKRDFAQLQKLCGVDGEDIADMLRELRG